MLLNIGTPVFYKLNKVKCEILCVSADSPGVTTIARNIDIYIRQLDNDPGARTNKTGKILTIIKKQKNEDTDQRNAGSHYAGYGTGTA